MSASNGGLPSDANKTFFNNIPAFPDAESAKIDTVDFLEAAKGIVELIDKFGALFSPVTYDLNGNIEKLYSKYNENSDEHRYLDAMILKEHSQGGNFATDALQWLRRALHFMCKFLKLVHEDYNKGINTKSLSKFMEEAYNETLRQYHGWLLQKGFAFINSMCPNRNQFIEILALGRGNHEEQVMRDMEAFVVRLQKCIDQLVDFYQSNMLETVVRV